MSSKKTKDKPQVNQVIDRDLSARINHDEEAVVPSDSGVESMEAAAGFSAELPATSESEPNSMLPDTHDVADDSVIVDLDQSNKDKEVVGIQELSNKLPFVYWPYFSLWIDEPENAAGYVFFDQNGAALLSSEQIQWIVDRMSSGKLPLPPPPQLEPVVDPVRMIRQLPSDIDGPCHADVHPNHVAEWIMAGWHLDQ